MFCNGEQNRRWPTSRPGDYRTLAPVGVPQHFTTKEKLSGGPRVSWVAIEALPPGGLPTPPSGRQNPKWHTKVPVDT